MDPKNPLEGYAVGQRLRGQVMYRVDFGVVVEVGRVDGFPIDALVLFDSGADPGPAARLKVGDDAEVVVTELHHVTKKLRARLADDWKA
jgi:hypothetical protein